MNRDVDFWVPIRGMIFILPHWGADLQPTNMDDVYVKASDYFKLMDRLKEFQTALTPGEDARPKDDKNEAWNFDPK
jgi:hypothetical protein